MARSGTGPYRENPLNNFVGSDPRADRKFHGIDDINNLPRLGEDNYVPTGSAGGGGCDLKSFHYFTAEQFRLSPP